MNVVTANTGPNVRVSILFLYLTENAIPEGLNVREEVRVVDY